MPFPIITAAIIRAARFSVRAAGSQSTRAQLHPDLSTPVPSISDGASSVSKQQPDLTARAIRLCNRNKEATARYLAVHAILFRGREVGR